MPPCWYTEPVGVYACARRNARGIALVGTGRSPGWRTSFLGSSEIGRAVMPKWMRP